uniref:toxin-antitoxin system YwqK family antitoxin n=2 Tax=Flavobacterium sp. TaxID=239 RepID=UPI00404A946D
MRIRYLLPLLIILSSCDDDISNSKFRNENYVFYQENGKAGVWQKIDPALEIKLPKSHSTYFFPNGNRYAELEVIDSFPNRVIAFYNKNDKLTRTVTYKSDSIVHDVFVNGNFKSYYSSLGFLKSEGLIEKQMWQGEWKYYWNDGKTIKKILHYVNDTLQGMREDYWENGNLMMRVNMIDGKKNGESVYYYENGNLEERSFFKNGSFHGSMVLYFENKNIKSERKYWNGRLIDTCKTYFENGQLSLMQVFDLDTITLKNSGKQINYYPNGNMKAKVSFNDDASNITVYYENDMVKTVSNKLDNKVHGHYVQYHENGNKMFEGFAKSGYYNGKFKYFDKSGKLIKTVNYDFGKSIDSIMH